MYKVNVLLKIFILGELMESGYINSDEVLCAVKLQNYIVITYIGYSIYWILFQNQILIFK